MREFLRGILGTYTPVTYTTYEYINEQYMTVEVVPSGLAGVDWLYIISAAAFLMCVYCVFRVIGGLICKNL